MTTNVQTTLRPGTYTIDTARSTCRLTATHVFGLKPVAATVALRGGTVTVAADPAASSASAELDAATFHSDDQRRNRDITGPKFFDAAHHPVIAFRSTRCHQGPDGWRLTGVLRVRGHDSEVTLTLESAGPAGPGCHFVASGVIDRVAAGVATGRAIIARPVKITLDLYAG
ncbi:YceI family protein [Paractinoplanes maris]|uniref:YceI family protein n=1 Tax=Paractinoplanes maris TaxID=1734446 RepID=UPI00202230F3|nr:YceI family protein [Actinoplanes maris]